MKRRVVVALGVGLLFYALSDILLWQRIFEAHDLFQYDMQYQSGHVSTLVAMIGVGVVLLWDARLWALWYAVAFYTLTFSGLEDVLYYWLDGTQDPGFMPLAEQRPIHSLQTCRRLVTGRISADLGRILDGNPAGSPEDSDAYSPSSSRRPAQVVLTTGSMRFMLAAG